MSNRMTDSLKEQVLGSARALFMARGYEAVGMREIAQAVGRQPIQVYRLNLSKADILAELIIELNNELIAQLPNICTRIEATDPFERVCAYLYELYTFDIQFLPIRSVGAAFGWMWSAAYEQRVSEQVQQLVKPVADWMAAAGLEDIPARCLGIWSLYYVGYRHAVLRSGTATDCLAAIKPSLHFYLDPPMPHNYEKIPALAMIPGHGARKSTVGEWRTNQFPVLAETNANSRYRNEQ